MGVGANPPRPFWEALVVVEATGTGQGEEMLEVIAIYRRHGGNRETPILHWWCFLAHLE